MAWLRIITAVELLCIFTSIKCDEPHCSKYDFEEKVLEKLVRMEFNMEKTKLEIHDAIATIGDLKKSVELNGEIVEQKLKVLNDTMGELDDQKEKYAKELHEKLLQVDKTVNAKLVQYEETFRTSSVVFKARSNADISLTAGQMIVFPEIMENVGHGYDASTGVFTAPVNGTYMFTTALCMNYQKELVSSIMVNGIQRSLTLFYGDGDHSCHTADAVAVLKGGHKVWVQVISGSGGSVLYHTDSYRWNTFSGVLVNA